jgi:hypothetical protein
MQMMERRVITRVSRRITRRACSINVNQRKMRYGRKRCQRTVKRWRCKSSSTLTTGMSTTSWLGLPTNKPLHAGQVSQGRQKEKPQKANSATVAAAAASAVNPYFSVFMATLADLEE